MSEVTTSGETSVAPVATPSVTPAPVPAFGSSRGSGLARGKRSNASTPATQKEAAPGNYQPTSIQVVNHQREYKNPFAPEPAVTETVPAKIEPAPAAIAEPAAPAVQTAATVSTPTAPVDTNTSAPKPDAEPKAELNILPPEEKNRPAQSWEIEGAAPQPNPNYNQQPRREGRPERRDRQERYEGRPENREQRSEYRPRERREGGERREQRTFEPKPTPAVTEAKKSGFLGWLKGLFGGESTEQTPATTEQRREDRPGGEGRRHEGGRGGRRHHRGGRGGFRGENRGPQGEGQQQGSEQGGGERRFDGNRGGRRHHRGGRGRFRGENRGGENRHEGGSSGNPAS